MITLFGLEIIVQHGNLVELALQDFFAKNEDVSPTLANSILSILNRFLITMSSDFLAYLEKYNIKLGDFFGYYFHKMDNLTSRSSIKIHSIALMKNMEILPN